MEFGVSPSTSRKPILVDWDGFFEDSCFDSKHAYTETERCCSARTIIIVLHFLHVGYALFKQQTGEGMVAFGILALPFPLFSSLFFPLLSHSCLSIMSPPLIPFFSFSFFEARFSSFRISLLFGFGFLVVLRNSRFRYPALYWSLLLVGYGTHHLLYTFKLMKKQLNIIDLNN